MDPIACRYTGERLVSDMRDYKNRTRSAELAGGRRSAAPASAPGPQKCTAWLAVVAAAIATCLVWPDGVGARGQDQDRPRFKGGVSRVNVAVTVRDRNGRLVTGLDSQDFVVIDAGSEKPVTDFEVREGGVSVAAVLDASGSMAIAGRLRLAVRTLDTLFAALGDADEAALFAFDSTLRELHPFTRDRAALRAALEDVRPFGSTSLHDAIAEAARAVTGRPDRRGAVLIVTDGMDTSSALSPVEASGIASSVDVPIYVVGLDPSSGGTPISDRCVASEEAREELPCLSEWTGGAFVMARASDQAEGAVQRMVSELRHQYMIAFEPATEPGWHPIEVRARGNRLLTRTRSWYWVGRRS